MTAPQPLREHPLRRRSLEPERVPEFPPRAPDAPQAGASRRGLAVALGGAVVVAALGAGALVGLRPSAPRPAPVEVASAEAADIGPVVAHTNALPAAIPAQPALPPAELPPAGPPPAPEASASVPAPAAPPEPAPVAAVAALPPEPAIPAAAPVPAAPVPAAPLPAAPAAASPAAPSPAAKPADAAGLVVKGEAFLKAGDLASARLFFGRAAQAGDPRGAEGMAATYDPDVVRKLPVYGLPANRPEADRWYARARELEKGRALAQQ